jgi:hypothetical protein
MSLQTRLINFLLPLAAYILFVLQWLRNYVTVWYANIPEETHYLRARPDQAYSMLAQTNLVLFVLFLIAGLIQLFRLNRLLAYGLIGVLVITGYLVFLFSLSLPSWNSGAPLNYLILVLLALSACRYYLFAHSKNSVN